MPPGCTRSIEQEGKRMNNPKTKREGLPPVRLAKVPAIEFERVQAIARKEGRFAYVLLAEVIRLGLKARAQGVPR